MKHFFTYSIIFILILFNGCTSAPDATSQTKKTLLPKEIILNDAEAEIAFTLFNYIFKHNGSYKQQNVDYYFLSIQGKVPTQEFINRFTISDPKIVPDTFANPDVIDGVTHINDGGTGLKFIIGEIKWIQPNKVKVLWGYYENGYSGAGNIATLELINNQWKVVKDVNDWVA